MPGKQASFAHRLTVTLFETYGMKQVSNGCGPCEKVACVDARPDPISSRVFLKQMSLVNDIPLGIPEKNTHRLWV